jgi:hypothetical protein
VPQSRHRADLDARPFPDIPNEFRPAQITPGALVIAGDEEAAAVCQVIDLVPAGNGTTVHLRPLPGLEDYQALAHAPWPAGTASTVPR